jgi:hypothetical protein
MVVTRNEGRSIHHGDINIPSEERNATITMSRGDKEKTRNAWGTSLITAETDVGKLSELPSEAKLGSWLPSLGATYAELQQGQESEVPLVATLYPVSKSFIDILEGAFAVEKGKPTSVVTDFLDSAAITRYDKARATLAGCQDDLLRETISAFPVEGKTNLWDEGGATRVKNNNVRLLRNQPGTLRWGEDGEERKRFVLYNLSERDFADVYQSWKRY